MNTREESSALEFLDSLIEDTPDVRRAARRERLRLELARFMKKARDEAGLTQQQVAKVLGVTQAWVSKLESANYDHKLESVLSYFDALEAEMSLSVDVGATTFQIWGSGPAPQWEGLVPFLDVETLSCSSISWEELAQGVYWSYDLSRQSQHTQTAPVVDFEDFRRGRTTGPEPAVHLKEAKAK